MAPETLREQAHLTYWSVQHFLSGFCVQLVWAWTVGLRHEWLSSSVFVLLACAFELYENRPGGKARIWAALGYSARTYTQDSLRNAVTDVLVGQLGWLATQVVLVATDNALAARFVLLGVAGVLLVGFLLRFAQDREDLVRVRDEARGGRGGGDASPASDPTAALFIPERA